MSAEYENQDPIKLAQQAERDLNSAALKQGKSAGDSTLESGVDEAGASRFPGGDVTYGSAASGAGNNRDIPLSEGGDINPNTGKLYKAGDFEGLGGPEDKAAAYAEAHGGADAVRGNVRQQGESTVASDTARTGPSGQPVSEEGPGYTDTAGDNRSRTTNQLS